MEQELDKAIRKCFRDTYMQTEGETDLFDTEETIEALKALIHRTNLEARASQIKEILDAELVKPEYHNLLVGKYSELKAELAKDSTQAKGGE